MKKSVMKKWVKALRSGNYKQGKDILKSSTGDYCCLGVLCDISRLGTFVYDYYETPWHIESIHLPREVQQWAGMRTPSGEIKFPKGNISLITLNDTRGRSFKQIAAFIERNWEKL